MNITEIIELLQTDDFMGVSREIEIAKGKHARISSFRQGITQLRRITNERKNKV